MAAALTWRFNGSNGGTHGSADLVGSVLDSVSELLIWQPLAFLCSAILFSCRLKDIVSFAWYFVLFFM